MEQQFDSNDKQNKESVQSANFQFEAPDITNAYEEHDKFFKNIDNSEKARKKREGLKKTYFGDYSEEMRASIKNYDAKAKDNQTVLKKDMANLEVKRGFLEMDGNNPMMAFANEVSESLNEPPYFETHIHENSHGTNVANVSQHTFVRFHATVYNKDLRRMVRYVFAVGHHQRGLLNDYHFPSTIAMRKEVKYSDVQKGFAFINRYRINRNEDWKLLSTNCNRFAKSVAESMGFSDMANLHDTVSCVGSFNKIRKAMYEKIASKNSNLQFFSMEERMLKDGKKEIGDIQQDLGLVNMMSHQKSSFILIPDKVKNTLEKKIGSALAKELKVKDIEDLKHVKDEYNEKLGQNKMVWFKKKKQRQIAVYDAYRVMKEYVEMVLDSDSPYKKYMKELYDQFDKEKTINQEAYEAERDQFRASIYQNLLVMVDDLLLVTKGLKESSILALKFKGDLMGYKAMSTNESNTRDFIFNYGVGKYHAYALDKFMEDDVDAGIYMGNKKMDGEDTKVHQASLKIAMLSDNKEDIEKEKNLSVNGHFILQRIMNSEAECIKELPAPNSAAPVRDVSNVFNSIRIELETGKRDNKYNQRLLNYMQMMIENKAGYTSSPEVMAWTMVQFIIAAVKDLWSIRAKNSPIYTKEDYYNKKKIDKLFISLYNRRVIQATEKEMCAEFDRYDGVKKDRLLLDDMSKPKKSRGFRDDSSLDYRSNYEHLTKFSEDAFLSMDFDEEVEAIQDIQQNINYIHNILEKYAISIFEPSKLFK